MSILEDQETEVPELAVHALQRAQRRAKQAGYPLVFVKGGQLVRVEAGRTTILKELPGRRKVFVRARRRTP